MPQWDIKYTAGRENLRFLTKIVVHIYRKWYEIRPWLLWITNRKSQVAKQCVSVPMTSKGGT